MNNNEIELYEKFLELIMGQINSHFESQKGCALCCSNGEYPCSELEAKYLLMGFSKLSKEIKNKILENIKKIKENKQPLYPCPFLIDNKCSVYEYRMIVCRTFGLLYYNNDNNSNNSNPIKIPFCYEKGLNYSEVYDNETKTLWREKCEELGYKNKPIAYNLDYKDLKIKFGKEIMDIDFGEEKALINWL